MVRAQGPGWVRGTQGPNGSGTQGPGWAGDGSPDGRVSGAPGGVPGLRSPGWCSPGSSSADGARRRSPPRAAEPGTVVSELGHPAGRRVRRRTVRDARRARVGERLPQERHDAAFQQRLAPRFPGPGQFAVACVVAPGLGRGPVAQGGEQQADRGDEDRDGGHGAEDPPRGEHGPGEGLPGVEHLQHIPDEQEDRRGRAGEDRCQDGDDGDGAGASRLGDLAHGGREPDRAGARFVGAGLARGRRGAGRRRVPQFLADLDVVLVLGRGRRGDERGGAQRHGAQLFGVQPLTDGGQFRAVWCGAQRFVEDPLVLLTVLAQQLLRNAVHVHPRCSVGLGARMPTSRRAETEGSLLRIDRW